MEGTIELLVVGDKGERTLEALNPDYTLSPTRVRTLTQGHSGLKWDNPKS